MSQPRSGGVSACCNLLHLLDDAELSEVFNVLVSVMSDKGISTGGAAPATTISGPSGSSRDLEVVLAQIKALAADAKQRVAKACASATPSAPSSSASSSTAAPVEGKSKLDRWAARTKAPAPAPTPAPAPAPVEGKSKLDRWAARTKAPAAAPAPAAAAAASAAPEAKLTPIETAKQVVCQFMPASAWLFESCPRVCLRVFVCVCTLFPLLIDTHDSASSLSYAFLPLHPLTHFNFNVSSAAKL